MSVKTNHMILTAEHNYSSMLYNVRAGDFFCPWFWQIINWSAYTQVQDLQNRLTSRSSSRKVMGEGPDELREQVQN